MHEKDKCLSDNYNETVLAFLTFCISCHDISLYCWSTANPQQFTIPDTLFAGSYKLLILDAYKSNVKF